VSVLQGIKERVGSSGEVVYSLGCKITETEPDWNADKVVLGDAALNAKRIQDAVKVAQKADIAILVLGENEQTSREAWAVEHPGDRDNLDLLGNQDDLVKAIVATGKPVVVFLLHGGLIRSMPLRKLCRRFWMDGIWGRRREQRWLM